MKDFEKQVLPAIAAALEADLPEIEHSFFRGGKIVKEMGRPTQHDVEIYAFPQSWSDTSLGFGGMAGQAFTSAYTTVVISELRHAVVYIGGRRAYKVEVTGEFMDDVRSGIVRGIVERPSQRYKLMQPVHADTF